MNCDQYVLCCSAALVPSLSTLKPTETMSLKVRTDIFQESSMTMATANIQEDAKTFCVEKMAKQKRNEVALFNARQILLDLAVAERRARLEVLEMVGYEEPKERDRTEEPTKQDIISRLKAERRQRSQRQPLPPPGLAGSRSEICQ
jgi:hypothetical protein